MTTALGAVMASVPPRQKQVGSLIAEGLTNEEIADRLGISKGTVETHRADLFARLDIHNVADMTKYALARGWIKNKYQRGRPRKDLDED